MIVGGCGQTSAGTQDSGAADIKFPDFAYRSEEALAGYRIAAVNQDILEQVPCYCGCVRDPEKYQNLKDCFYNRNTGGFDEHAAGCTTCLDEAGDIGQWKQDGLSVKDIRQRIDEKYSERGEPTRTPPVP
ncbi:MAG: PCYCGC motif-containing (lipo)protein [Thermoleophilia bacterium]